MAARARPPRAGNKVGRRGIKGFNDMRRPPEGFGAAVTDFQTFPRMDHMNARRFFATQAAALVLAALPIFSAAAVAQQESKLRTHQLAAAESDRIVRSFTAKETQFRQALNQYRFKREAVVQTVGLGGQITGEYRRDSNFTFDDQSNRYEKITFMPASTLTEISITAEDIEDLGGVQPFALELSKINQYDFVYVGKEKIDEIDTYVFDVAPKSIPKKVSERFFKGRVWVDDQDLQIVKVRGKGVPEGEQRFPTFETYREQVDGKFWFPTYTAADDELVFKNGQVVRVRMRVRYSEYKRFAGTSKILEEGDIVEDEKKKKP